MDVFGSEVLLTNFLADLLFKTSFTSDFSLLGLMDFSDFEVL